MVYPDMQHRKCSKKIKTVRSGKKTAPFSIVRNCSDFLKGNISVCSDKILSHFAIFRRGEGGHFFKLAYTMVFGLITAKLGNMIDCKIR